MTVPFVYIIRDVSNQKRYAGVKFAKGCKPSDLLTKYFTSSKVVKGLIAEGREFAIDKIVEFDSKEEAIEFEELLLLHVSAHTSREWYNQSAGRAINPEAVRQTSLEKYGVDNWMKTEEAKQLNLGFQEGNTFGCFKRTEETKKKMSEAFTGREFSEEHKLNIAKAKIGTTASQETRDKMSKARSGVPRPASFSEKMSVAMLGENNPMYGKVSPRKGLKDPTILCPHCNRLISKGNYNRWHGENCKLADIENSNTI